MTVMQSMKLGIDVNRHKEIIVKAVSAILLLLLKHFKVFEIFREINAISQKLQIGRQMKITDEKCWYFIRLRESRT